MLNQKFGKDTVLLGMTAQQGKSFRGAKIAFTRIPDIEEFMVIYLFDRLYTHVITE